MAKQIKKHGKTALILSLILMMVGMYAAILPAEAGDLDNRKVTVDDSTPGGTGVDYAFVADFTGTPNCIEVVFSAASVSAGLTTTSATQGAAADWTAPFTIGTWADIEKATPGTVRFWDATGEAAGSGKGFGIGTITNPTAGVYTATINTYTNGSCTDAATCCANTATDTGTVAFAIVAGVTVSVTVTETLSVTVAAASPMDCIDLGDVSATGITATAVPFGSTSGNSFIDGCQQITIGTNAVNGYVATAQEDDQLTFAATNEILDGTCDGSCTHTTGAAWGTNTNNGFGYCMEDKTGLASATADGTAWAAGKQCDQTSGNFKTFANISDSEAAQKIMENGSATGGTSDVSEIGFRISVSSGQTAGAYENEISYIVTPKY
jgi:hypothetical protein